MGGSGVRWCPKRPIRCPDVALNPHSRRITGGCGLCLDFVPLIAIGGVMMHLYVLQHCNTYLTHAYPPL